MKFAFIKRNNHFEPYYNSDIEEFKRLKNNTVYMAEVKKPRSIEHHKKLFALANCTVANLPEYSELYKIRIDAYGLIKAIERELGMYETEYDIYGKVNVRAKSIDFESMDQLEFQTFYDKAVYIMAGLIGITTEELEQNSLEYV